MRTSGLRSIGLFLAGLALWVVPTLARADERCGEGRRWTGRECEFIVVGEPQGPQRFVITGRGAHGWTPLDRAPADQRARVVEATRRAPF